MANNSVVLNTMNHVKPSELAKALHFILDQGLVPYIEGPPGSAKSSIVHQVAVERKRKVIDRRLSQMEAVDLTGALFPSNGQTTWYPPDFFVRASKSPKEHLFFFDEYDKAPPEVQNASLGILLDRMIGDTRFDGVDMILAGNRIEDRAGANRISTAARNRLVNLQIQHDPDDYIRYWVNNGFHHYVIAFCRYKPSAVNEFVLQSGSKEHRDKLDAVRQAYAFATPRSWEFVSKMYHGTMPQDLQPALLAGTIGEAMATEFLGYIKIISDCPDIDVLLMDPQRAPVPKSPAAKITVATALGQKATPDNFERMSIYLDKLEPEYQIMTCMDCFRRDPTISVTKAGQKWFLKHQKVLS